MFSFPDLPSRTAYSRPPSFAVCRGVSALDVRAGLEPTGNRWQQARGLERLRNQKGDLQVPSIFPLLRSFCRAVCPSLSSSASSSSISSSFRPAPVSRYAVKSSLRGFFLLLSSSSLRPFRPPFRHTYLSAPAMSVPMRSTQRRLARDLSSPASHAAPFPRVAAQCRRLYFVNYNQSRLVET